MESFVYEALTTRVVFGSGTVARISDEADRAPLQLRKLRHF